MKPGWRLPLPSRPFITFLGRRLAALVLLGLGITFVAFVLTELVPGDPAAANLGQRAIADPAAVKAFREHYGLDKPLPVQYVLYLEHLANGDLGQSEQSHRPVRTDLGEYIPATAELAVTSILIAFVLGIGLGILSAVRRNRLTDQVLRVLSLGGISMPTFWLALVALYVFFFKLGWVPGSGRLDPGVLPAPHVTGLYTVDALLAGQFDVLGNAVQHLILPAFVLAAYNVGLLTRFTRSAVLEVINNDYIQAARAKGLPERTVISRHVLRAALPPIITVGGLAFANVMTGTVLVESIFAWPGIGQYAFHSATTLDLPAIMGVSLFVAVVYIIVNFVVDILYGVVDPRFRIA
ncbi:MAG TPA: ABC transporter permease [Candidatus Sulfotelmatobacter sp.]|nr:ABC transporter permease [Candidatus Sulfotelmatobacter sp.]